MENDRNIEGKAEELKQYIDYVTILSQDDSGRFKIQDDQEGFAVIANLKRVAKDFGLNVQIHKRENYIYFFKEDEKQEYYDLKNLAQTCQNCP